MRSTPTLTAGQLRGAELATVSPDGRIEFRIQRPLKNFNSRNRNAHWRTKHASRCAWVDALKNAVIGALGMDAARQLLTAGSGLYGACGVAPKRKRRVDMLRLVPSKRNFIRDEFDNLRSATKELRDAITSCGLIWDDSSRWCAMTIAQDVSPDGTWWTVIRIEDAA